MAAETAITVVGNLTADPELRFTALRRRGRRLHRRLHPAHVRPPVRRMEGRRGPVPALQHCGGNPPRTSPKPSPAASG